MGGGGGGGGEPEAAEQPAEAQHTSAIGGVQIPKYLLGPKTQILAPSFTAKLVFLDANLFCIFLIYFFSH